ncbi:MAG TPA: D,D-dipeptide ABC transporter permease, partial [Candidatus Aminicenantes bacterium]|nr:D,D-dipeptide ABC transporter permease [Candidatus Aminicenantes bacterium]
MGRAEWRLGMGILLLLGIFLIAGALGGSGATTIRVDAQLLAPGTTAPFGTDELGRDILASTARAGIFSALLALLVTLLAVGSGSGIGLAAGLAGG